MAKKNSKKTLRKKKKSPAGKVWRPWLLVFPLVVIAAAIIWWIQTPRFDGDAAFSVLQQQCDFGARVPGTDAHRQCGDFLADRLESLADRFYEQRFEFVDRNDSSIVYPGRNMVASFNLNPQKRQRIMICAHWDSRPVADHDRDPQKRHLPVPGANDGASGVAVLLELARVMKEFPPDVGVDLVLFDLEDLGDSRQQDSLAVGNPFCIGSAWFADNMGDYRPSYGILLDMVGDRDQKFPREGYSMQRAAAIVDKIWRAAAEAGESAFVNELQGAIWDDHVSFLQKGIPVIDIIDFDYQYWHTTEDTPDKCSAESLQSVGNVLVQLLYHS